MLLPASLQYITSLQNAKSGGSYIDVSSALTEMNNVEAACNFDLDPLSAVLATAVADANSFDFTSIQNSLTELRAGLRTADVQTYASLVAEVIAVVKAIDFGHVRNELTDFNVSKIPAAGASVVACDLRLLITRWTTGRVCCVSPGNGALLQDGSARPCREGCEWH